MRSCLTTFDISLLVGANSPFSGIGSSCWFVSSSSAVGVLSVDLVPFNLSLKSGSFATVCDNSRTMQLMFSQVISTSCSRLSFKVSLKSGSFAIVCDDSRMMESMFS